MGDCGEGNVFLAACLLVRPREKRFADSLADVVAINTQIGEKQKVREVRNAKADTDQEAHLISRCDADTDIFQQGLDTAFKVPLRILRTQIAPLQKVNILLKL